MRALLDGLEEVLILWLCETGDREVIDAASLL